MERRGLEDLRKRTPKDAYEAFQQAKAFLEKTSPDAKATIKKLDKAIKLHPDFAEAYSMRGHAHMMLDEWGKAKTDLDKALSLSPTWSFPRVLLGFVYLNDGKIKEAEQAANMAVGSDLEFAPAYELSAAVDWGLADYQKAIEDLTTAIRIEPENFWLYCRRSAAYRERAKFDHAMADIQKAQELAPGNIPARVELARLYWRKKEINQAIATLEKLLVEEPKEAEFYVLRGLMHLDRKDLQRALADFDKSAKLAPNWPMPGLFKAIAYHSNGFPNRAQEELGPVLKRFPDFVEGLLFRGDTQRNQADIMRAVELRPHAPEPRFELASVLISSGDYSAALQEAQKIIDVSSKYPQGHLIRCQVHEEKHEFKAAYEACQTVLELDPFMEELRPVLEYLKNRGETPSVINWVPPAAAGKPTASSKKKVDPYNDPQVFTEVLEQIKKIYVTKDLKQLIPSDAKAPDVKSLLDQLDGSSYLLPVDPSRRIVYSAIGVKFTRKGDMLVITSVSPESPAAEAGVKRGERILAVDKKSAIGMTFDRVSLWLQGEEGSTVTLLTEGLDGKQIKRRIIRRPIYFPSVVARAVDADGVGYIRINSFSDEGARDTHTALEGYRKAGCKYLVLDLRGNAGGTWPPLAYTLGKFLRKGSVMSVIRHAKGTRDTVFRNEKWASVLLPTAILVDGGTLNGGEAFVAAMKDNHKATVFGQKTGGMASIRNSVPLSGGDILTLTTGYLFTPNGVVIEGNGISPDVEVQDVPEKVFGTSDDFVLKRAIDFLKGSPGGSITEERPKKDCRERISGNRSITECFE